MNKQFREKVRSIKKAYRMGVIGQSTRDWKVFVAFTDVFGRWPRRIMQA